RIELRDTASFNLPDPEVDPGTMEIEEAIENIRKQTSQWVRVDRPASPGSQVSLDVTTLGSPEHPEERTDAIQIEVGDPQVWEEVLLAVQGMSAGQETTF